MASALFFDVDGTLIDSYHNNRTITPAVRAELERAQALGHKIFLSSGRGRMLLTPELLEPAWDGMVLINGGYVEVGGKTIYETRMDPELARKTAAFLEAQGPDTEYLIMCARKMYTRPENHAMRAFFSRGGHEEIFTFDFDLDEVLMQAIKMETLTPVEDRARMTSLVHEVLGPQISCDGHGGEGTFELYPTAISKAKGVQVALEHLGIEVRDSYAFGDGTNDLEMLRFCGCGVAMGNAEDAVKAEADIICPPVWEDGLAQALHELF